MSKKIHEVNEIHGIDCLPIGKYASNEFNQIRGQIVSDHRLEFGSYLAGRPLPDLATPQGNSRLNNTNLSNKTLWIKHPLQQPIKFQNFLFSSANITIWHFGFESYPRTGEEWRRHPQPLLRQQSFAQSAITRKDCGRAYFLCVRDAWALQTASSWQLSCGLSCLKDREIKEI